MQLNATVAKFKFCFTGSYNTCTLYIFTLSCVLNLSGNLLNNKSTPSIYPRKRLINTSNMKGLVHRLIKEDCWTL